MLGGAILAIRNACSRRCRHTGFEIPGDRSGCRKWGLPRSPASRFYLPSAKVAQPGKGRRRLTLAKQNLHSDAIIAPQKSHIIFIINDLSLVPRVPTERP